MAKLGIGAVVTLKSGGGKMTVTGGPSADGLLLCTAFDSGGWFGYWLPLEALKPTVDELVTKSQAATIESLAASESEARRRNRAAIETLREAFKLRADCKMVDEAAEDAAAEYRAYREESAVDARLYVRNVASQWRSVAASYPDGLSTFLDALRSGQDWTVGNLRRCAADVLEVLAK